MGTVRRPTRHAYGEDDALIVRGGGVKGLLCHVCPLKPCVNSTRSQERAAHGLFGMARYDGHF